MATTRGIEVGMLVRTAAGKKLGEVESLELDHFTLRRSGLFTSTFAYAVHYDDVLYRRAGAVVITPSALHPLSVLLARGRQGRSSAAAAHARGEEREPAADVPEHP